MSFCLPKNLVSSFLSKLKDGTLDPEKLAEMSSAERHAAFADVVGEANARQVNALFESKLLLKNQQQGILTWAKSVSGLKPQALRDIVSKVNRMTAVLEPKTEKAFLADLAEQRLGTAVTLEEAGKIMEYSRVAAEAKVAAEAVVNRPGFTLKKETKEDMKTRVEYGLKLQIFRDYVSSLKPGMENTSIVRDFINTVKDPKKLPINIGNLMKSLVASFDDSFFLNQGIFPLFDPRTTTKWLKAFGKSFSDITQALGGRDPLMGVKAEVYSRPNALSGLYNRMKLDIGLHTEEAIPTTVMEKIPLLGRFFKASNAAYSGAAIRLRADIADMKIRQYEKNGIDLNDKFEAESLGNVINAFTGRGDTGRMTGENVNAFVFSAKFAKSKFDVMTAHLFSDKVSPAAKKVAMKNLMALVATSAGTMILANAINPGSTSFDPRSTRFGKIRIGKTWYPTPLAFGGLPNLFARTLVPTMHDGVWGLWMQNQTGKWTALLTIDKHGTPSIPQYGAVTAQNIMEGYFEGKASPILKTLFDFWNGQDFNKNPSTPLNLAKNAVTPISVSSIIRAKNDPNEQYKVLSYLMQFFGSNASVEQPPKPKKK